MEVANVMILAALMIGRLLTGDDPSFDGLSDGGSYYVDAYEHDSGDRTQRASSTSASDGPPSEYVRAPRCVSTTARQDLSPSCPNNDPITQYCLDGSEAQLPLWRRTQDVAGNWSDWELVQDYTCPADAALVAAINREWTQLHPQPSDIALQPNTGWVIATVPTIAMAADAPRAHQATLLGADVEILATASGYRWEWGDGTHTSTRDPGRPYPYASLTHTYPHASDQASVHLTTTWSGQYRVNGGVWHDFDTTISSASTPVELVVYDPRSRLVSCTLDDDCRITPHK